MGRSFPLLAFGAALLWPALGSGSSSGSLDFLLRAARKPTAGQLERSISVIKSRATLLGGSGVQVTAKGSDEIIVHIASISNPSRARALLASRGRLDFYDLEADLAGRSIDARGRPVAARKPPAATKRTTVLRCGNGASTCPDVGGSPVRHWFFYLVEHRPEMTGADLIRPETRADVDPNTGRAIILMQFTPKGVRTFQRMTATEARRGKARWIRAGRPAGTQAFFQHFAIVLDGRILSFPSIDFQQYPNGISAANGAEIAGLHGTAEATGLALLMKTGTLPVRFTVQR